MKRRTLIPSSTRRSWNRSPGMDVAEDAQAAQEFTPASNVRAACTSSATTGCLHGKLNTDSRDQEGSAQRYLLCTQGCCRQISGEE
jgi:hypothetical protein